MFRLARIFAIAASTPYSSPHRETLAKFLVRLLYRPNLTTDGKTYKIDGLVVWRDLPALGWELREAWNFGIVTQNPSHSEGDC
jgi:hypothetical protein